MKEVDKIKERYDRRKGNPLLEDRSSIYIRNVLEEREQQYKKTLNSLFPNMKRQLKLIEIGAGEGVNIEFFKKYGVPEENITVTELLPERVAVLKSKFPGIECIQGDSFNHGKEHGFDIAFQSLVFTSILDDDFKIELGKIMWELVKPGGVILWYDFIFNNPTNPDVKGIKASEVKRLFPFAKAISFRSVTLAPPIGRRVGRGYHFINKLFPFLRSHLIAVIHK
jgi:phospholipid N-methyltransferase